MPGPQAVVLAEAWANQQTAYRILGWEDEPHTFHAGAPPWFPTIVLPPAPDELERHLQRMEAERQAGRERERAHLRGDGRPAT